jgi:hypothetical protein
MGWDMTQLPTSEHRSNSKKSIQETTHAEAKEEGTSTHNVLTINAFQDKTT